MLTNKSLKFIPFLAFAIACSEGKNFGGSRTEKTSSAPAQAGETPDTQGDPSTASDDSKAAFPPSGGDALASRTGIKSDDLGIVCKSTFDGDTVLDDGTLVKIVNSTSGQAPDFSDTQDSIVILKTTGNGTPIEIDTNQVSQLKGLCLDLGGDSYLELTIELKISGIFISGRGSSKALLAFKDTGTFDSLTTELGGASKVEVDETMIDCKNIVDQNRPSTCTSRR